MTAVEEFVCQRCGGPIEFVDRVGDVLRYRCRTCGLEVVGTVSTIESIPRPKWVALRATWRATGPSITEIRALRELFPEFAERRLGQLVSDLRGTRIADLGRRVQGHALELQKSAKGLGLNLEILPEAATEGSDHKG